MNYYNPYFNIYPYTAPASTGLIGRAIGGGGIKWGSILSGTQKVLGVANQAIPMFKKVDAPSTSVSSTEVENESTNNYESYDDGPTFFI